MDAVQMTFSNDNKFLNVEKKGVYELEEVLYGAGDKLVIIYKLVDVKMPKIEIKGV